MAASLKPRPGLPHSAPAPPRPQWLTRGPHGLLSRVTCLQTLPEMPLSELQNVPRPGLQQDSPQDACLPSWTR